MPSITPGPLNLITDVDGIEVGNAEDRMAWTGATVVLPDRPAVTAVDVRGGAPATRETDALAAGCFIDGVHAVVLSGGSVFGLDAASAATQWLAGRGIGFPVGSAKVPVVPAAILFDLLNGGDKDWGGESPYRRLGIQACATAGRRFTLGNAGAGFGACSGRLKGGLGSVSAVTGDGLQIGALVAVNSFGDTVMPGQDCFWAWALEQQDEMGGQPLPVAPLPIAEDWAFSRPFASRRDADPSPGAASPAAGQAPVADDGGVATSTTIGVIATNAILTKPELLRIAIMAQDGYARAIRPVHTPFDGDTVFAVATGRMALPDDRALATGRIGAIAADCMARAVARGVYEATRLGNLPAYRELHGRRLRGSV
jgi:L-aminopeptidase/D-esterase-like protein